MGSRSASFQQTSLGFISFPNPVEPSTFDFNLSPPSGRHPSIIADEDFFWTLRDSRLETSLGDPVTHGLKRRHNGQQLSYNSVTSVLNPADIEIVPSRGFVAKASDQTLFQLPLPAQRVAQRQKERVPPVLQGLHQPPPNAGLLPSIEIEKRRDETPAPVASSSVATKSSSHNDQTPSRPSPGPQVARLATPPVGPARVTGDDPTTRRRRKWSPDESRYLLAGAQRFGIGAWKAILTCPAYTFDTCRRPLDLKDRFRVLSANPRLVNSLLSAQPTNIVHDPSATDASPAAAAMATAEAAKADTIEAFKRKPRRPRTHWDGAEDEALLAGLKRYGRSWVSIQLDPLLKARTPTDIRDRIRTRFPGEYAASRPTIQDAATDGSSAPPKKVTTGRHIGSAVTIEAQWSVSSKAKAVGKDIKAKRKRTIAAPSASVFPAVVAEPTSKLPSSSSQEQRTSQVPTPSTPVQRSRASGVLAQADHVSVGAPGGKSPAQNVSAALPLSRILNGN